MVETKVYVDVLLVLNYIINMLLVLCTARLCGRKKIRKRIVAASIFGSMSALTIFLPFFGFVVSILTKLFFSSAMVLIAFPFENAKIFFKELFAFFASSFFFAGIMLAVWMGFSPSGMIYYNGIVYFDISSIMLLGTTILAYTVLVVAHRLARGNKLNCKKYDAEISLRGKSVKVRGLVDTGNSLVEPFSGTPVMVCYLSDIASIIPDCMWLYIQNGEFLSQNPPEGSLPVRLIPYRHVGGENMLAGFRCDRVVLSGDDGVYKVEDVYIAVSVQPVGQGDCNAILHPDLVGRQIAASI